MLTEIRKKAFKELQIINFQVNKYRNKKTGAVYIFEDIVINENTKKLYIIYVPENKDYVPLIIDYTKFVKNFEKVE